MKPAVRREVRLAAITLVTYTPTYARGLVGFCSNTEKYMDWTKRQVRFDDFALWMMFLD